MDCARAESIFSCPRTRDFFLRFEDALRAFAEADRGWPFFDLALAEVEVEPDFVVLPASLAIAGSANSNPANPMASPILRILIVKLITAKYKRPNRIFVLYSNYEHSTSSS